MRMEKQRLSQIDNVSEHRDVYVISDIHGDFVGFIEVMHDIVDSGYDPKHDLLIQLGDMIDGYGRSCEVVKIFRDLQNDYGSDRVIVLRGNHEEMLLNAIMAPTYSQDFQLWWQQGGRATATSYGAETFTEQGFLQTDTELWDDADWFGSLPLCYETDTHLFVHAGLNPFKSREDQSSEDILWIREPFLSLDYNFGKIVVAGHTALPAPLVKTNTILMDTRYRGRGYISGLKIASDGSLTFFKSEETKEVLP
jgi:serine/threonine protein phosphatase 1